MVDSKHDTEYTANTRILRDHDGFAKMPPILQQWILKSPYATADFAGFFAKGGAVVDSDVEQIASYRAEPLPEIHVNRQRYAFAREPSGAYSAVGLFSTLAHEVGHDKDRDAKFKEGGTAAEYVQFRSEKEAKAIFNAFPIFADLAVSLPEFKPSWREVGYDSSGLKWGSLFGEWRQGVLKDHEVVKEIAGQVAGFPYTRRDELTDQDGDGSLTQRDLYLRDYQSLLRQSSQSPDSQRDARSGMQTAPPLGVDVRMSIGPDLELYRQARDGVAGLGAALPSDEDADRVRLAAALTVLAKENGLSRIDHVVLSRGGAGIQDGDNVFVVEGRLDDPAHRRAHMNTEQAMQMPNDGSIQRIEALNKSVETEPDQARQVATQDSTQQDDRIVMKR